MEDKDHDILIRLETNLERAIQDIARLGNNQEKQMEVLNTSKLDSKDFVEWAKMITENGKDIQRLKEFKEKVLGGYAVAFFIGSSVLGIIINLILKHYNI